MTKALTLHQPWASLVALGVKTIETRSWSTDYRGPLLIHAGMRPPSAADFGTTIPAQAGWIGAYNLGKWATEIVHAEPCDCDEDEEQAGDRCMAQSEWKHALLADEGAHGFSLATSLPLGASVASCTLADVVPIVAMDTAITTDLDDLPYPRIESDPISEAMPDGWLDIYHSTWGDPVDPDMGINISSEAAYGDFAPGRFAWLLEDVKATTERCPACWGRAPRAVPGHCVDIDGAWWHDPGTCTAPECGYPERDHGRCCDPPCTTCDSKGSCDPIPAKGHQRLWAWTPAPT